MRLSTLSLVLLLTVSTTAFAAEPLQLLYQDRPPYYVSNADGSKGGLVSGPVEKALKAAGIPFTWVARSGKGQMAAIRRGGAAVCSPGWFRKPEREVFAKFSDPVYRDRPQVVITQADNRGVFEHRTLAALFADKGLRFGVKAGYSYGPFADDLIAAQSPPVVRTTQDVGGMVRMLLGRRFDYILAAPEEFESLADRLGIAGEDIAAIEMTDIPPGNARYLMCSKDVTDEIIGKFNTALAAGR